MTIIPVFLLNLATKAPDYAADFSDCKQLAKDRRDLAKINPDTLTLFAMGESHCP